MATSKHYICVTCKVVPEDGKYSAYCIELGTATCGDTVDAAIHNIREAIHVDLNALARFGERSRFFKKRGIRMYGRPVSAVRRPVNPKIGEYITRQNIPISA